MVSITDFNYIIISDSIFIIDSEKFKGNLNQLIDLYNRLNPSKKFRIWLIDLGYKIYEDLFSDFDNTDNSNHNVTSSNNTETNLYWQNFLPTVEKLLEERKTGKNKTGGFSCESWWKSRFSDFLTNTNSQYKSHEDFLYRQEGFKQWDSIWNQYSHLMLL